MELNITEFDNNYDDDNFIDVSQNYAEFQLETSEYEKIPENTIPIKVIKKGVHFEDSSLHSQKPINQKIPKPYAKMVRPQIQAQKPKISYEDILSKMGMLVSDGKLHLVDRNTLNTQQQQKILSSQKSQEYQPYPKHKQQYIKSEYTKNNIPNNSYIYNKYFKNEIQSSEPVRKPRSLHEYKMMIIDNYIERQRIKQMKSTKLMMPTSNINMSAGQSTNLNKLFGFSKR